MQQRHQWIAATLLVIATCIAIGLPTLHFEFAYDDHAVVLERPPAWESSPTEFFTQRAWGLTRHLTLASLDLNRRTPQAPLPYRATNLLLGATMALLAMALARQLGGGLFAATSAGLLFAVHPTHVDAVVAIVGRAELLAALFVVLAVIADLRALRDGYQNRAGHLFLLALCYLLGLFSKENAAVLPALLVLGRIAFSPQSSLRSQINDAAGLAIAFLPTLLVWMSVALPLTASLAPVTFVDNPLAHATSLQRILGACEVLLRYAGLIFAPWPLAPDRAFAATNPQGLSTVLSAATVLLGTTFLVAKARTRPLLAWSGLWFLVAFLPTSNLVFPAGVVMAERLLYLPSLGPIVGSAIFLGRLYERDSRGPSRRQLIASLTALTVTFAAIYTQRALAWKHPATLHRTSIAAAPNSAKAHFDAGLFYQRTFQWEKAEERFANALRIYPAFEAAAHHLAEGIARERNPIEGLSVYLRYLNHRPDDETTLVNAIRLGLSSGRPKLVLDMARHLRSLDPANAEYRNILTSVEKPLAKIQKRRQSLKASSESGKR